MSTLYFIDKNGLYGLQKIHDLFLYNKDTKTQVLSCSLKYKRKISILYYSIFKSWKPEQIQKIVIQSNKLTEILIRKYGDFTQSSEYNNISYVDKLALNDMFAAVLKGNNNLD